MITEITKDNFKQEVEESKIPVVVDFWAPWCGHCINLAPTIDEIASEYDGKVKFCKLNIDEQQELAINFGVMSIPTVIKFVDGQVAAKTLGAMPKDALVNQLEL